MKIKKLNKKGFTLIELLVVISILSLVLSISMYIIIGTLSNAREKTYKITINEVEKAAESYLKENSDDLVFAKGSGNVEYQCVSVKDLIDYGFLNNDVIKSKIDEYGNTIGIDNNIYIERDAKTKAIKKNVYIKNIDDDTNRICAFSLRVKGTISFVLNPTDWSKNKNVEITYTLKNVQDISNYVYEYVYYDSNNNIISEQSNANNNKSLIANKTGNIYADIKNTTENSVISTTNQVVNKIDNDRPTIELVNENDERQYVSKTVTIPLRIKDCDNEGVECSGLKKYNSSELSNIVSSNKIVVKIGNKVLDNSSVILTKIDDIYNLTINNTTDSGSVSIQILENTFLDMVVDEEKNGNKNTLIDPNVMFDNEKPKVEFVMLDSDNNIKDTTYYSLDGSDTSWFNFTPTLRFIGSDSGSGLKSNATISWNNGNVYELSTDIHGSNSLTWEDKNDQKVIEFSATSNGYRYIVIHVCDEADNCVDKEVYYKFDNKVPVITSINNPYNNVWHTGSGYQLTLNGNDSMSGIANWQYTYNGEATTIGNDNNVNWIVYSNSSASEYKPSAFSKERNQPVYIRLCDVAGNCSNKVSTMIMIDRTPPTLGFEMYNGINKINETSGSNHNYYVFNTAQSVDPGATWLTFYPKIRFIAIDNISEVKTSSQVFTYNSAGNTNFNVSNPKNGKINTILSSGNSYYFDYTMLNSGNRYVAFKICDNAGLCTIKHVYFKISDTINAVKYHCTLHSDPDGKNRFRVRIMNVTQCNGSVCNYNKLNGLTSSYDFSLDSNNPVNWSIDQVLLSDNLEDLCSFEYYIVNNNTVNCYNGASASSGVKKTISPNCTKISSYRTTMKVTNGGSDSWYYISGNDCYINGSYLTSTKPSACDSSSPPPSNNGKYHVTFNANGGKWSGGNTTLYKEYYPTLSINSVTKPTRSGCSFKGWTYNGSPRVSYLDSQENGGTIRANWYCSSGNSGGSNCPCKLDGHHPRQEFAMAGFCGEDFYYHGGILCKLVYYGDRISEVCCQ